MIEFLFGIITGVIFSIIILFSNVAFSPAEVELSCYKEMNQRVASMSADLCPAMIEDLTND